MALPLKFSALASVAAVIVAACQPSPCDQAPPSSQVGAASLMTDCLNTLDVTPVAQMPKSGQAFYNGFVTGSFDTSATTTDSLIGTANLTATYAASSNAVFGTLANFSTGNMGALGGTLTVGGTAISGNTFVSTIAGNLTGYGTQSVQINTGGAGGFLGDNADGLAIGTTGTSAISGGYSGTASLAIVAMK
jgi:hypothetical protein